MYKQFVDQSARKQLESIATFTVNLHYESEYSTKPENAT